jgi:hypothetical protein
VTAEREACDGVVAGERILRDASRFLNPARLPVPPLSREGNSWSLSHGQDDGHLVDLFDEWVSDAALCKKILVDNPARLYGF